MSNVIDFLERLGRDAQWRHAPGDVMEAALIQAGIEAPLRAAIIAADRGLLESLVGANPNICCLINHPEEEEESREEEEEDDGGVFALSAGLGCSHGRQR
jgi:hypothetical protein